jgi:hypothetical protein
VFAELLSWHAREACGWAARLRAAIRDRLLQRSILIRCFVVFFQSRRRLSVFPPKRVPLRERSLRSVAAPVKHARHSCHLKISKGLFLRIWCSSGPLRPVGELLLYFVLSIFRRFRGALQRKTCHPFSLSENSRFLSPTPVDARVFAFPV